MSYASGSPGPGPVRSDQDQAGSASWVHVVARSESGKVLVPGIDSQVGKNPRQITGSVGGGGPLVDVSTGSSSLSIEN